MNKPELEWINIFALMAPFIIIIVLCIYSTCGSSEKYDDYQSCKQVGGSDEQCEKIVYPERWEEEHLRQEQMRNKLKSYWHNQQTNLI